MGAAVTAETTGASMKSGCDAMENATAELKAATDAFALSDTVVEAKKGGGKADGKRGGAKSASSADEAIEVACAYLILL